MNQSNRENIVVIRAKTFSPVIPMPSRERTLRARAAVVQMPSRFARGAERSASVIAMPERTPQDESESAAEAEEDPVLGYLPSAVRLTLLALFTWLGWPWPTHGKDPGAASARPWKPAMLSLISKLHLPAPLAGRKEAAIVDFPAHAAGEFDSRSVVNLHAA